VLDLSGWKGFGECVGDHVICRAVDKPNGTVFDDVVNKVKLDVDVFGMSVVLVVFGKCDGGLVVQKKQYFTLPGLFHMESMEWVEADGFHGISRSFHEISRWIPYCLSQTSCHLKIPYKTHM